MDCINMLKTNRNKLLLATVAILIISLISTLAYDYYSKPASEITNAPTFTAVDVNGNEFSLNESKGKVTIIHITGIENPVCIECEKQMQGQLLELNKISEEYKQNISIIKPGYRVVQ